MSKSLYFELSKWKNITCIISWCLPDTEHATAFIKNELLHNRMVQEIFIKAFRL